VAKFGATGFHDGDHFMIHRIVPPIPTD